MTQPGAKWNLFETPWCKCSYTYSPASSSSGTFKVKGPPSSTACPHKGNEEGESWRHQKQGAAVRLQSRGAWCLCGRRGEEATQASESWKEDTYWPEREELLQGNVHNKQGGVTDIGLWPNTSESLSQEVQTSPSAWRTTKPRGRAVGDRRRFWHNGIHFRHRSNCGSADSRRTNPESGSGIQVWTR